MGLFKTYSYNGTILTDTNTVYVSSLVGIDTNTGTRVSPVSTITKAASLMTATKCFILANGLFLENATVGNGLNYSYFIADNNYTTVQLLTMTDSYLGARVLQIYKSKISTLQFSGNINANNCEITTVSGTIGALNSTYFSKITGCFIENYNLTVLEDLIYSIVYNNTILSFKNYIVSNSLNSVRNSIFVNSVDLYNFSSRTYTTVYPIFKYCLFRKATVWKWNGAVITINYGTYGNATGDYMADVISGLYAYANAMSTGTDKTYFLSMIPSSTTSNIFYIGAYGQSCKVVEDRPSIGGSIKIFNRYVNDIPVDYSLWLNSTNVATTMSDINSNVGCYQANADVLVWSSVVNVNTDGTDDTGTTSDMLIYDQNGQFHASSADSVQIRNRARSNVFNFKRGVTFMGLQSQMKSGLGSRFSFGKFQLYNTTTALTLPMESIEVIPYDSPTLVSAFPRFSAMFNDVCKMWYISSANTPILFSQLSSLMTTLLGNSGITLTNAANSGAFTASASVAAKIAIGDTLTISGQTVKVLTVGTTTFTTEVVTAANTNSSAYTFGIYTDKNLTEYGAWAVTNADYESLRMSSLSGITLKNIPVYYAMLEINLNYYV